MCSAVMGQGKKLDPAIKDGMRWLLETIRNSYEKLSERVTQDVSEQRAQEAKDKQERAARVRKQREARYGVFH